MFYLVVFSDCFLIFSSFMLRVVKKESVIKILVLYKIFKVIVVLFYSWGGVNVGLFFYYRICIEIV